MFKVFLRRLFGDDKKHPLGMSKSKMERFTQRARRILFLAQETTQRFHHGTIEPEHLLLALLAEEGSVASHVLRGLGVESKALEDKVSELTRATVAPDGTQIELSAGVKRVLELAVDEARRMGNHFIGSEHLLLGLIRQPDNVAVEVLQQLGITVEDVRRETIKILQAPPAGKQE